MRNTKVGKKKFNDQSPIDYIVNGGWEDHLLHSETPKKPVECSCPANIVGIINLKCPSHGMDYQPLKKQPECECHEEAKEDGCIPENWSCTECKTPNEPDDTGGWEKSFMKLIYAFNNGDYDDNPLLEDGPLSMINDKQVDRLKSFIKALLAEERERVLEEVEEWLIQKDGKRITGYYVNIPQWQALKNKLLKTKK